jgi:glycogen synthase
MRIAGMKQNFSWKKSAEKYVELYQKGLNANDP